MKAICLSIFALLVGFVFYWQRETHYGQGGIPASIRTQNVLTVPTLLVGSPSITSPPELPSQTPASDEGAPRLEEIAELARITLPTQKARDQLINALSQPELQSALSLILQASDHLEYNADQEKQRMNAVSALGLILRYKEVSHRDEVVLWIKQRILAVDFDSMKDIRVKRSIYGDITELLMILKQYDSEEFEEIAQRISETNRKALKTALAASL